MIYCSMIVPVLYVSEQFYGMHILAGFDERLINIQSQNETIQRIKIEER
jgi:hypothetical protein